MRRDVIRLCRILLKPPRSHTQLQQLRQATTTTTGAFLPDPEKASFGLFGIFCTVVPGLLVGATISKNIASFLEENDLFVPSDDDDDDD